MSQLGWCKGVGELKWMWIQTWIKNTRSLMFRLHLTYKNESIPITERILETMGYASDVITQRVGDNWDHIFEEEKQKLLVYPPLHCVFSTPLRSTLQKYLSLLFQTLLTLFSKTPDSIYYSTVTELSLHKIKSPFGVDFHNSMQSYNHHHNQAIEHFQCPKIFPRASLPFIASQDPTPHCLWPTFCHLF